MFSNPTAYLQKGIWYTAAQVDKARVSDKGAFQDAHPYTIAALKRRREYGNDVPTWFDLNEQNRVNL
jgi:hypothetical protein